MRVSAALTLALFNRVKVTNHVERNRDGVLIKSKDCIWRVEQDTLVEDEHLFGYWQSLRVVRELAIDAVVWLGL